MSKENRNYPSEKYAWYMVVMLTIAYILSFVDRYVLGLLIEPIKADLDLTDTEIGLLLGFAFAIFYATMGLPLGYLADRKKRLVASALLSDECIQAELGAKFRADLGFCILQGNACRVCDFHHGLENRDCCRRLHPCRSRSIAAGDGDL